jgi:large subunit ribosomal protein L21
MYAVIETGGKQYRVGLGDVIRVEKLAADAGQSVELDRVLLVNDGNETRIGAPLLSGATVGARVMTHGRADKVHIFKMRRRKNFRRHAGHRQHYTEIEITRIGSVEKGA